MILLTWLIPILFTSSRIAVWFNETKPWPLPCWFSCPSILKIYSRLITIYNIPCSLECSKNLLGLWKALVVSHSEPIWHQIGHHQMDHRKFWRYPHIPAKNDDRWSLFYCWQEHTWRSSNNILAGSNPGLTISFESFRNPLACWPRFVSLSGFPVTLWR